MKKFLFLLASATAITFISSEAAFATNPNLTQTTNYPIISIHTNTKTTQNYNFTRGYLPEEEIIHEILAQSRPLTALESRAFSYTGYNSTTTPINKTKTKQNFWSKLNCFK